MKEIYDIVVVGAGLTGLTTAFYLKKQGADFLVLEKEDRVGGQINTFQKDGFTYESGPNTGVIGNPEVAELFQDMDASDLLEIADPAAKRRLIWKGEQFHELPSGLISGITTPLFTLSDKFNLLLEPLRSKGTNPNESIAAMVLRRMGKSFLDYAVDPFLSGVYAGDPNRLITRFALPKLYRLEQDHGGFIRGAIAKAKLPKSDRDKLATKDVFSTKGGLSALTNRLHQQVGDSYFRTNVQEMKINPIDNNQFEIRYSINGEMRWIKARKLITTVPAHSLVDIISFVNPVYTQVIKALKYAPVLQISVGFKSLPIEIKPAFGGLVPSCEKRNPLGILYPYACFKNRTPEGGALFSFFLGGMKKRHFLKLSDDELKQMLLTDIHEMLKIPDSTKPDMIEIFRHPKAIPQYEANSEQRFDVIDLIEKAYPNLRLGGNIKDGIGMADRIKQGKILAYSVV